MPVRVTFLLDKTQHQKLKIVVAERHETLSKMLRRAVDEYLAENGIKSPTSQKLTGSTTPIPINLKPPTKVPTTIASATMLPHKGPISGKSKRRRRR